MIEEEKVISRKAVKELESGIQAKRDTYRKRAARWKNWFRIVIVGAAIASASAATLPKFNFWSQQLEKNELQHQSEIKTQSPEENLFIKENMRLSAELKDAQVKRDTAVLLAFIATILTSLIGLLDFESYWHANRQARHRLESLLVSVKYKATEMSETEYNNYVKEFRTILLERAERISPAAFQLNDIENP